jgi:hypothetical protein
MTALASSPKSMRRATSGRRPLEPRARTAARVGQRHPPSGGDRLALAAQLARVWEGLLAAGAAECPLCAGRMERVAGVGRCSSCGSTLG